MKYIIKDFVHRLGHHCESSSMRDLFEYHGFPMSEAMAFGLDGTIGFGFFDISYQNSFISNYEIPFFIGGKQGTIEPNSLACRLLGINLRKQSFTSVDRAWEASKKLITQNIPLIIRVDIAYMPYERFDKEIEISHFGGHTVVLAGYDDEKNVAYIADTEYKGLQEVPISILKKARSSTYGPSFLHPKNTQFSMIPRLDGKRPPFAAGVKLAIQQVVNNMLRPSMNFNGIQGLKRFASSILTWEEKLNKNTVNSNDVSISLAQLMFELIYGYIETWGTGGGLFRYLYKDFLKELLENSELKRGPRAWDSNEFDILENSITLFGNSARNWTLIAETLKSVMDEYKEDCLNHIDFAELQNVAFNILATEEKAFKNLLKIKI